MSSTATLLSDLVALGERQLDAEHAAADLIGKFLKQENVPFTTHEFSIQVPRTRSAVLTCDGKKIPCAATCFVSGVIPDKEVILSSAAPMAESPNVPNINVNPYCPVISRGNCYRKPAVAVTHEGLAQVFAAKEVRGEVDVEMVDHTSRSFLIGNTVNPRVIVFNHYDSIGPGANDNASGVATVFQAMLDHPEMLDHTLIVVAGAEELSQDQPFYWGSGYRRFQDDYGPLMNAAKKILVVDSVGSGTVQELTDMRGVRSPLRVSIPIRSRSRFSLRTSALS